ncbi:MAG TPA: hypothetical protein DDZ51_05295 [Planctomycetaceae bacterium]|nr:hypothetical protein [Planctomycetaceae bacterium]
MHHVYLVGQGALYPLVQQRLEQSLQIPFLGPPQEVNPGGVHPRFVFDRSNLKGAVARGAVLLRMAEKSIHGVEVTFDEDLSERLPFTIGYDENKVAPQTLFKEHQRYRELIEKKLPVPEGKSKKGATDKVISLTLKRRWPGDENWESFLEFYFDKAIADQSTRMNAKRPEPYIRLRFSDDPNNSDTLGFVAELVQDDQTTTAVATFDGTAAASENKVITRVIEKGRGRVIHRHPIVSPRESGDL